MKQASLQLKLSAKKTRKQVFLAQMEKVVPWDALVALIAPYYPQGKTGRPPFSLHTMLRVHFLQQWFTLSDPAMEEAFFDVPLYREFAQLAEFGRLPDESTILRFRHLLEKHKLAEHILATINAILIERGLLLKSGTVVDATLIAAPSSTKNKDKARDPEMHSSQKGNQWHFGMKAHIGVDEDSGLVHTVRGTSGNVNYPGQGGVPIQGDQAPVWARQNPLPGFEEEHGAVGDLVCAVQFVDGQAPIAGDAGMSAPAVCPAGANRGQMRLLSPNPGLKTVICGFGRAKDSQSLRTCGWWRYAMGWGELFRASLARVGVWVISGASIGGNVRQRRSSVCAHLLGSINLPGRPCGPRPLATLGNSKAGQLPFVQGFGSEYDSGRCQGLCF